MNPFDIPSNAHLSLEQTPTKLKLTGASNAAPAPTLSVGPAPQQTITYQAPFTPAPTLSLTPLPAPKLDIPDLNYAKVNYFIADGSQKDPSTGKPFKVNTPVFEGPDYLVNSKEFQQKIEPLIQQPVKFDDQGKVQHIMNTQEFKTAIDDFVKRHTEYEKVKSQLHDAYQFDNAAGESYIDAFTNFKQTGQVTLPFGDGAKSIKDLKADLQKMNDLDKGFYVKGFIDAAKNQGIDPEDRGRALAVVDALREAKLIKASGTGQAQQFLARLGAGAIFKPAYSLVDTLTPDSIANIAKFDQSQIGKNMEISANTLNNLDGYSGFIKAGEVAGLVTDIAASLFTGREASIPAKFALVKSLELGANTLKNVGLRTSLAGDGALIEHAGNSLLDASRTADKIANWTDSSEIAKQLIRSPIESVTIDALTNENDSFGEHWLRNALLFTAGDAALIGMGKTYKAATDASRRITAEGMNVEHFDKLNNAIFEDGDHAIKLITEQTAGKRPLYQNVPGIENRTDDVLASNNSVKALMESATLGLVDRFKAITPEQAGELIIKGHQKGEVNKILGKELGDTYSGIRETLRKHLNRIGLKVDNLDEYIFRSGVTGKQIAGRAPSDLKTVATAEGERQIATGGELLTREGELADVGIGNTILKYVRSNMGAAINRLTAARMIQSGTVVREAAPGSAAYRAARNNGGLIKIVRDVDGKPVDTGFVATKDWLSNPANGSYVQVERNNPMIGDALNTVKKNSKNYIGGFYATTEDLQKITNYATRRTDELRKGALPAAARLFERGQDLVLSGGIPFTPLNSFGVAQMLAAMATDPLHFHKYAKAFGESMSDGLTRKFYLSKLYSDDPLKFNLSDAQKYGLNLVPRNLFSHQAEAAGIKLANPEEQARYLSLQHDIPDQREAITKLQKNVDKAKKNLDDATEKLASAETRTTKTDSATLKKAQTKVNKLEAEHKAATKELEDAHNKLADDERLLKELDSGFQEGNVGFDLLESTGNSHLDQIREGKNKVADFYDKAISDATFKRFMPMLQTLTTENIVNKALARGMSVEDAYAEGAKSLKRFWNIGPDGAYGSVAAALGATNNEKKQVLSDLATLAFTAPKYRAAIFNRVWNTIKAIDPRKMTSLEYRLNVQWAMTMGSLMVGWQLANKAINGRYTWQNPTGSFDELQIPIGDGNILRLSLFGTQLSIVRAVGRMANATARGDTEDFAQGLIGTGSIVGQPIARLVLNKTWTGDVVSESDLNSKQGLIDRAKFLLSQYTGHPLIKALEQTGQGNLPGQGNILNALLTATESPINVSNMNTAAKGEFFGQVIPDVEAIKDTYQAQISAAFDDQEKKVQLMKEMFDKIKDRVGVWGQRYGQDISQLPDDMSRALLKSIVAGKTPLDLGGTDTLAGSEQISTEAAQKRLARQYGQNAGLDLYSFDDRTKDLADVQYGAPAEMEYEFQQLFKENKDKGIASMYDIREKMYNDLKPLYDKARGLHGRAAADIYHQIDARQEEYLQKVVERIKPLIDKYGANVLANNHKVLDAVAEYVVVPGDYTPFASRKKQPYLTRDAAAFIKDYFGVGDLSQRNIPTDAVVKEGIAKANADIAAGRQAAANFKLSELQQKINTGKNFADPADMARIKDMIKTVNHVRY